MNQITVWAGQNATYDGNFNFKSMGGWDYSYEPLEDMHRSKYSLTVLLLGCLLLFGCISGDRPDHRSVKRQDPVAAVRQYVSTHRHWATDQYTVKRRPDEGQYYVYHVVNFDDFKRHYRNGEEVFETGSGKSFVVYYEPSTGKIVKEMWFQ